MPIRISMPGGRYENVTPFTVGARSVNGWEARTSMDKINVNSVIKFGVGEKAARLRVCDTLNEILNKCENISLKFPK